MTGEKTSESKVFANLRERALEELRSKYPNVNDIKLRSQIDRLEDISKVSIEELPRLIYEVQVYQIELELQNEELRRTYEKLESAKTKYESLYNSAPVGYVTLDMEGRITEANAMAAHILGAPIDDLLDTRLSRYISHNHAKAFHHLLNSAGGSGSTASEILDLDSSTKPRTTLLVEASEDTDELSGQVSLRVVMTDVTELQQTKRALEETNDSLEIRVTERTAQLQETNERLTKEVEERRAAQNALHQSEERLRALFEGSSDLILIKDREGRIVQINSAVSKATNLSPELIIGKTEETLEPESAKLIEDMDARALKGEVIEIAHSRMNHGEEKTYLDNRLPLRDDKGHIIGVCVISRDITERAKSFGKVKTINREYPSAAMQKVLEQAAMIASTDGIVLILGESGSGKDFLARWIHDRSPRKNHPYFSLNCAALSPELAESELFGYETGAFTGASGRKRGLLELAEGGTILLNEIGELPLNMQSKLLTFLDTHTFMRVGGEKPVSINARLMAATHRDLTKELESGGFLEPLYHRLNVFRIKTPPLRERKEDLPVLVEQLMAQLADRMNMSQTPIIDQAMINGLAVHDWPGNVRELRNTLERALMLWKGERFEPKIQQKTVDDETWSEDLPFPSHWKLRDVTDEITKNMCMKALKRTQGNKKEAAKVMGISRDALYRYIRRFKIEPELLME